MLARFLCLFCVLLSIASSHATAGEMESVKQCTLRDGTVVPDGWSGKDTGDNYCNSCSCGNGMLLCTEMACEPREEQQLVTSEDAKQCTLRDGTAVPDGWSGKDTGDNYCNSCSCHNGLMACTAMLCPPQKEQQMRQLAGEDAKQCTLRDGTVVPDGWSGKDTGDNYCNSCSCHNGLMACTLMLCPPQKEQQMRQLAGEDAKQCTLRDGTVVPNGWSGKDTGDNYCNSCSCHNGLMACTAMLCPVANPQMFQV